MSTGGFTNVKCNRKCLDVVLNIIHIGINPLTACKFLPDLGDRLEDSNQPFSAGLTVWVAGRHGHVVLTSQGRQSVVWRRYDGRAGDRP